MNADDIKLMDVPVFLHPLTYSLLNPLVDSEEARRAMKSSHLYMIITRPRITASIADVDGTETITFRAAAAGLCPAVDFSHPTDLSDVPLHDGDRNRIVGTVKLVGPGRRAQILDPSGNSIVEIDVCQLAVFLAMQHGRRLFNEVSVWEVQYVGQAYGTDGRRSALDRLEEGHKKYARIITDAHFDQDVYVVPIQVAQIVHTDGLYPAADGPPFNIDNIIELLNALSTNDRRETPEVLSLIENALIAFFQPPYNEHLKSWPAVPRIAQKFRDLGVGTFVIAFDGADDIANVVTARRPEIRRSAVFAAELRGERRIVGLDDSGWNDTRQVASIARNVAERAEKSGPSLRFFSPGAD